MEQKRCIQGSIRFMFPWSHKRSLANSQRQNAFFFYQWYQGAPWWKKSVQLWGTKSFLFFFLIMQYLHKMWLSDRGRTWKQTPHPSRPQGNAAIFCSRLQHLLRVTKLVRVQLWELVLEWIQVLRRGICVSFLLYRHVAPLTQQTSTIYKMPPGLWKMCIYRMKL